MLKKCATLAAVTLLAGCARSGGVLPIGPDTYTVSVHAAPISGGEPGARAAAIEEANKKCQAMGRQSQVDKIDPTTSGLGGNSGTVGIVFRCVSGR